MTKSKPAKIVAAMFFIIAAILIVAGIYGISMRVSTDGQTFLDSMRIQALLSTTGEGAVESFIAAAKKEATDSVKANGGGMAAIREAVAKAEEQVRSNSQNSLIDYDSVDTAGLSKAINAFLIAMEEYSAEEARAQDAYIAQNADTVLKENEVEQDVTALGEESMSDTSAEDLSFQTQPQVDLSGFKATEKMLDLMAVADEKYVALADTLIVIYPVLDQSSLAQLKGLITDLLYQPGDQYEAAFDRYEKNGGAVVLKADSLKAKIIRYGDDLVTIGISMVLIGLMVLFYSTLVKKLGIPRVIITSFLILLCVLAVLYDLSLKDLLSNAMVRTGMNLVLVLAMVPGIQCGIGLNLGLPLGILGGLLGGLMCIEYGLTGWVGFGFSIVVGSAIAGVIGYLYAILLNRVKGQEMSITTYVGFSIVSLMCIGWLVLPFKSPLLRWPLGTGLRVTLSMRESYRYLLNDFLQFRIAGFVVPTGLVLFGGLCCLLVWLFMRTKTGTAMQAVGKNQRFAEAAGINVDKMRIIGTVLSTMLGAVGIIVYSQGYGFMQLYTAPRMMGFVAASAVLIGGASVSRARISNVIIGTFLFQGVLTLGMPVANVLVPQSTISETMRILISNGIILYALTKSGGASRA